MDDKPGVIMLPPVLYGIGLAAVLALRWFRPLPIAESGLPFWLGLALLVVGGALGIWGQTHMGAARTNVSPSRPTTAIVTSGPFRVSRNPLYLALNLLFVGYLERKFGETYLQYKRRVRRYL
jgi:protein-S-isoprenylcysteine O-methyltransferase Ste14